MARPKIPCNPAFTRFGAPARRPWLPLFLSLAGLALAGQSASAQDFSKNDAKVDALLSQMTLDEKIGQMVQVDSSALANPSDVQTCFLGSILSGGNSDPANNLPQTWRDAVNGLQCWALKTRLKIPLLYGIDAVHGHNNIDGAVIFPHHIGLGATHDPALVRQAEQVTAQEVAGTGIRWAFAPCIAVAQDERWGRTYESYGSDTALVSDLGAASVLGLQGDQLSPDPNSVLACAKHYLGDGGTQNGKDQGNDVLDEATLRKLYLPPYVAAIRAGVGSIMVSYSSVNGVKMHGNQHLLTEVLKGELGFQGFLVSDWAAIDQISPDYKADVALSINAGLDMIMIPYGPGHANNYTEFIADLKSLVADGIVPVARIDDAVRRILRIKVQMGLLENPWTDPALTAQIGSPVHRQIARQCVRESLVILKNDAHTLPLSKHLKHLVVVGAAADNLGRQCGGWTISWQGGSGTVTHGGTTLLAAIRQALPDGTEVTCSPNGQNLPKADAVIVVIGENPYAEGMGDRTNLDVTASDAALVNAAQATGAPVITLIYSGRPLVLGSVLPASNAIVAAWLPGTEGGGMADILFGDASPTGKLPRPWPVDNTQLSAQYPAGAPLFPLGFGLTY